MATMDPSFARCPACGLVHVQGGACGQANPEPPALGGRSRASLLGATLGGKYRIQRVLGEGGMGTVFEALHLELGRSVAVKVLLPHRLGNEDAVRRFHREARAAAAIGHPNICDVYDFGKLESGAPYLVMEKLVGETLAAHLQRTRTLPLGEAVDILMQVLSGLSAAHAKGIIHRDIKPENVFLAQRQGLAPLAKVLDFGISKIIGAQSTGGSYTELGAIVGTALYLAPEQARGKGVDSRVDLYACGVMLYEALTGQHPHHAANVHLLLQKIVTGATVRPCTELRPDLPPEIDRIVGKAMARSPDDRYGLAAAFQADLQPFAGAKSAASMAAARDASDGPAVAPPLEVGRYALYNVIASGGMAAVHYGRQKGAIGFHRTVAIKRLHATFANNPTFVSMFVDEARVAARIRHPNVVATLDVVAEKEELFLVMEYVPGESLARLLRRVQEEGLLIPPPIVSAILSGVLHGLHAAHEARAESGQPLSIVHRDVSPQNVLVGADGAARILDFGIAKASERLHETHDGTIKGKTSYMAPEQIRRGVVDRRTDIYSAAVVLWEALTAERLYEGPNEAAVFEQVLLGLVDAPSARVPDLPLEIDAVVSRGLDADPSRRYATARQMALEIERAIPPALASEVAEWMQRTAGEALQERARLVAEIEREHAVGASEGDGAGDTNGTSRRTETGGETGDRTASHHRTRWIGAAVVLMIGCVFAGAVAVGMRGAGHAAPEPNPTASPSPPPIPDPSSSPDPTPVPPTTNRPDDPVAPPTIPPTQPNPKGTHRRRHHDGETPPAQPQCDPPFIRDANGAKVWKRECL
jgi:serine/threonine protein kinase